MAQVPGPATNFLSPEDYAQLLREGRLIEPTNWNLCTLFDVNLRPKQMTPEELQSGFLNLGEVLYSEEETARRRRRFKERWRESRRVAA